MVPDWGFGGLGHIWYKILHHKSTLCVILELYANCQLPNMNKSVSRSQSYLEDNEGS